MYFAHTRDGADKNEWQPLIAHLEATAALAADLGRDAGVSELAYAAGLLHDIGKYSPEFQRRLEGSRQGVDHSTAGAREIVRLFPVAPNKLLAELISYCIAGHHSGLPDYGSPLDVDGDSTLVARRDKKHLKDYRAYTAEIDTSRLRLTARPLKPIPDQPGFTAAFLTRMIFSALVDADWLETEAFVEGRAKPRGRHADIQTLARKFNQRLARFSDLKGAINQKRTEILQACVAQAGRAPGFFTLTVPTGGGKTLTSMAFALNHALKHGLKRVIYVIPFTSIIEQNAGVFKDHLGKDNVLEHHSSFDWESASTGQKDETVSAVNKLRLAAENWDIPIVVTTNVQFFESLFANKKSRSRKLHNIAKSVIVFDEAQTLPREYLRPCLLAVQELVQNYGASAVFCTATQPLLQQLMPDVGEFTELAPNPQALFDFFKRVDIVHVGSLTDTELVNRLSAELQVLCIVNTRRHAKGLHDMLPTEGRYHLSATMCPSHRRDVLKEIRERLVSGAPCRVVSTQVIEAGVDIDFPVGYRAETGIDSISQAAGRVNREGRLALAKLYVFEPDTAFIKRVPVFIKQTAGAAREVFRNHAADPGSLAAVRAYFQELDFLQDSARQSDARQVLACFREDGLAFKTAAERFKIIDTETYPIIIPFTARAEKLVAALAHVLHPGGILRELQTYTVNVYAHDFVALTGGGAILTVADKYSVLGNMDLYHPETGLILPEHGGGLAVFID